MAADTPLPWFARPYEGLPPEERFAASAVVQYAVNSCMMIAVAGLIIAVASGAWVVLFVVAGPLLLGLTTAYLGLHGRGTAARRACVLFLIVGGGSYPFLVPGASAEIFLASNFPSLYLWFPERFARGRRRAVATCFGVYLFCYLLGERWGWALLSPDQTAVASVVVHLIFPIDLLGTVTALLRAQRAQQAALRDARDLALVADRVKSRILNSVAHELRSPLAACVGLLAEAPGELSGRVSRAVEGVLSRTTDLLDLARLESGTVPKGSLRRSQVGLILQRAFSEELEHVDIELRPAATEALDVDAATLSRTARHLAANVRKHGGGKAHVVADLVDGSLSIAVYDNGPGLPNARRSEIFEPFFGTDTSTDDASHGQGIGLALSRRLARAAGGDLALLDRSSGLGIQLRLPARPSALAPNVSPSPPLGLRVLVVEDERLNQKIVTRHLERLGCEVQLAEDGLEGVDAVERGRFDVVLMDVRMPRMDGLTATRIIKEAAAPPPIIALTANALAGDEARCLNAGMDAFLAKPFRAETFLSALGNLKIPSKPTP